MSAQGGAHSEAGARVADEARELWGDAKEVARSAAGEQQQAAARGLDDFAGALRQAAGEGNGGSATTSRVAASVADSLERLSTRLKERDLVTLVNDVEDFARAQPLVFFGAAVATGFFAMRFLKSSESAPASARSARSSAQMSRRMTERMGDSGDSSNSSGAL